jgi:hypothetical protein
MIVKRAKEGCVEFFYFFVSNEITEHSVEMIEVRMEIQVGSIMILQDLD